MITAGIMERIIFRLKFKLSPLLKRNKSDRIMTMSFLNTKMVLKAVAREGNGDQQALLLFIITSENGFDQFQCR